MTIEQLWYMDHDTKGNPPKMGRLAYLPIDRVWESVIDLAIAFESGQAGYRQVGKNSVTGECIWYWPHEELFHGEPRHMNWWKIPARIEKRCFALVEKAFSQHFRRKGQADGGDILKILESWKRTGSWRKAAAEIYPKHPGPPPEKKVRLSREDKKRAKEKEQRLEYLRRKFCQEPENSGDDSD